MKVRVRSVWRTLLVGLVLALAMPALALGQAQNGTSGDGSGSQSGDVATDQTNSQSAAGSNINQNQTNQNCVAGRDCVNNNVTNQNAFENAPVRRAHVRRVRLARTGSDLAPLFLIGALAAGGGFALLTVARRRGSASA